MKIIALLFLVAAMEVTPVQKVVQLLQGMGEKGKKEKHEEQVQFAAYKQFCDSTTTDKNRAIKSANSKMEQLSASIQKNEADAATLSQEIAQLDKDISTWEGDKKAATEVRAMENSDYMASHKDYSQSIDATERAITTLKAQQGDKSQALMQVSALTQIDEHAKKVIGAFLATGEEIMNMDVSAPQANAYEFQSQGVVDMLGGLHDKFEDKKVDVEKQESERRHQFEMLVQDLSSEIENASEDRENKAQEKASKLQKAAEQKGDLADTTATRPTWMTSWRRARRSRPTSNSVRNFAPTSLRLSTRRLKS